MAKKYRKTNRKRRKRSDGSWKFLKKRFQLKKRFRRFGLAFIIFFSVLFTLGVIYAWQYLTRPFARAAGTFEVDVSWDGRMPLNLLWLEVEDIENGTAPLINITAVSLNPTLERLSIFNLPSDYEVSTPDQGDHPLRNIYGVGNLLDPQQGIELAVKNASYLLGVPIEGYFLVDSAGLEELNQLFGDCGSLKEYLSIGNITLLPRVVGLAHQYLRTNLTLSELVRVVYYVWRVRSDKITIIDLDSELVADSATLDEITRPLLEDANFATERLKIQILNGTLKPGLASFAARVVQNMGGEVVRVGNHERQDLTKGFLVLNESGSYTARRLAHVFGVVDSRSPRSSVEKRADITVVLGLESFERIF
jgi:anionic cell wall polymer biosynthesis LytR-Cps2A-Psr (LCP) family protein